jgi:hypothetical protein
MIPIFNMGPAIIQLCQKSATSINETVDEAIAPIRHHSWDMSKPMPLTVKPMATRDMRTIPSFNAVVWSRLAFVTSQRCVKKLQGAAPETPG